MPKPLAEETSLESAAPHDPSTEALRRIDTARKSGAKFLDLSGIQLNLSRNRLNAVPEAIRKLTQLQVLYLSGNNLSTLPETIGQLSRLLELYLHVSEAGNARPNSGIGGANAQNFY